MYISSFAIDGYRSLKNVHVKKMLPVCVFHGLNNSGKSNILSALDTVFRRKLIVEETTLAGATTQEKHERPGNFWQGRITGFRDNFYRNEKQDITFSVSITFLDKETAFMDDILKALHPPLVSPGHDRILTLTGKIKYVDDDSADMEVERVAFGDEHVVFEVDGAGKRSLFPKLGELTAEQKLAHFENLMNLLADAFAVLPSDRYLGAELASDGGNTSHQLSPKHFKKWLFELSLSRSGHTLFEEIKKLFSEKPFEMGKIGFSVEQNGEIEIMVEGPQLRLPIGRLGSGYQQTLYIIATLVLNKGRMLGIEELEVNLSPTAQKQLFEKIKHHIFHGSDLVRQILVTSHSDYFRGHNDKGRDDVRVYAVEHNKDHTVVNPWTKEKQKTFFYRGPFEEGEDG